MNSSTKVADPSCADSVLSGSGIIRTHVSQQYHQMSMNGQQQHMHPDTAHMNMNIPTIVNAKTSNEVTGNVVMERNREHILNAPLPPLVGTGTAADNQHASRPSKEAKKSPKKKETGKRGRRSDPRMNRAVAARLANPNMSLLEALKVGGFDFPDLEPNRAGNPSTKDADNVQLAQRKNQLSRRLRQARTAMEGNEGIPANGAVNGVGRTRTNSEDQTSDVDTSRTDSTHSNYKRRNRKSGSKYRRERKTSKYRKDRRSSSRRSRHGRKKKRKDRKRSSRDYDTNTTDDTEYDSSDSYSSSSSNSSYSSSSSESNNYKVKHDSSSADEEVSRKHKNRKGKQSRKSQKAKAVPPPQPQAFMPMKQQPGQPFMIIPQGMPQHQFNVPPDFNRALPPANAQYMNAMMSQQRPPNTQTLMAASPLPQHNFMTAPPKKKIKHRSGDSVASGSVTSQSIASLNSKQRNDQYSMGSSIPTHLFSIDDGVHNMNPNAPPVPFLGMAKDHVDNMKKTAPAFTSEPAEAQNNPAQQDLKFDHDSISNDPKMIQALDYYRSEASNLYKRCLIMVGYTTVETEECDQIYLNFTAKAIKDDIIRWKRLRSFYLQCQLTNSSNQQSNPNAAKQSQARLPAVTAQQPRTEDRQYQVSNNQVISAAQQPRPPNKSDENSAHNIYTFSKKSDKGRSSKKEHYQRHMPASVVKDSDTTSHDRTEESEFTKQLEDIDTVSQLSNFDTISDFGSKNSYFSRHIHRLLGKSGPPPKVGQPQQQQATPMQQQLLPPQQQHRASTENKFEHIITNAPNMQPVVSGGPNLNTVHSKWNASNIDSNFSCGESRTTSEDRSSSVSTLFII